MHNCFMKILCSQVMTFFKKMSTLYEMSENVCQTKRIHNLYFLYSCNVETHKYMTSSVMKAVELKQKNYRTYNFQAFNSDIFICIQDNRFNKV